MRPSELLHVDDIVAAYCLDSAVVTFGSALKSTLDSATGKTDKEIAAKRTRILNKWIPEASSADTRKYRDPAKG